MPRNEVHPLTIAPDAAQAARQRFVLALKQDIDRRLRPQLRAQLPPDIAASDNREAIATALEAMPARQRWSRLARSAQELMWEAVAAPILAHEADLESRCQQLLADRPAGGELALDDALNIPEAMAKVPVHLQPGGYSLNRSSADVRAGALYEAGGALYSQGQSIDTGESKAEIVIRFLREKAPDFAPLRILDLCCSAGGSTTPYAREFPDAEIHGVDVAPALLRYAAARAESMGLRVRFHQQDASATRFADASFDLVVSHNAMHEMPPSAIAAMMAESYRLLKPGGITVHQDVPLKNLDLDAFAEADYAWERLNNNEPYWDSFGQLDLAATLADAGFGKQAKGGMVAPLAGGMPWYLAWARKED